MSQTVNLVVANNVGCGVPEGKRFPCSHVYGRTTAVYSCPSIGRHRIRSHVNIGGLKSGSLAASFVCKAGRNQDSSRQNNKHTSFRGRDRNNDRRDIFENFEEDMLSSKNGAVVSYPSGKHQATSSPGPGPREKEIVELFRKVQARLRERASVKGEKKIEAPQGLLKEPSAVDALLDLLKKHSAVQGKRSSGEYSGRDQKSNRDDGVQNTNSFDSNSSPKDESRDANIAPVARPRSVFQKKSPVPRVKYQPVSYNEDEANVDPIVSEDNVNNPRQIDLKPEDEPELEPEPESKPEAESEIDLDTKDELFFPELAEDDSYEAEQTYDDESVEEQLDVQTEVLSALKLTELRALAKSRGLKGYSKMKKVDLIELLTES